MAKDESGKLLSKVAKFVRNPLKDWSDLDAQDSTTPENGYSREMLKEMIERRQRNDFVRRREFDMLRRLRQREAVNSAEAAANPSAFNMSSSGQEGRAQTLKKIDEIEEQMSQQWWKGRPAGETVPGASSTLTGPEPGRVRDVRAYADTVPGHAAPPAPPAPPAVTESGALSGLHPSRLMTDTAIEEAAIRFAHGDDAGCEAILLQAIAPGSQTIDHDDSWRALLDMYRATGDVEKFERSRIRYVQRFGRLGPDWLSLRMLARDALAVARQDPASPAAPAARGPDWNCPAHLTREGLVELTRALGAAPGPTWVLNWRSLASIDADAAGPLKALFTHWANTPVSLRFIGVQRLMVVLAAATPPNDRRTDLVWWELRMSALRLTQDPDEFELVALNYCLTYEVSPPAWQDPVSSYSTPDPSASPAPAPPAAPRGLSLAMSGGAAPPAEPVAPKIAATLAGDILGDSLATWRRLDQDLAGVADPVISCAALVRVDFAAAGTLLTWVTERDARGERVEFVEAHRLMAALFNVVGIADHATVTPRND